MSAVWRHGARYTYKQFVKKATGANPSPKALLEEITMSADQAIQIGKKRIERLASVKEYTKPVRLNGRIRMVHGKKVIADDSVSFEDMAKMYGKWVKKQGKK